MKIVTDHKWKPFRFWYEIPEHIKNRQFSHLFDDDNYDQISFFCYKGYWYHLSDFMFLDNRAPEKFKNWHGYHSDSFFSGIVIKVSNDGEEYMIGTYFD